MPKIELDLIDVGGSFIGHVIKRFALYFAAGFVGLLIGDLSTIFRSWDDFLDPGGALRYSRIEFSWGNFFLWPIYIPFYYSFFALFLYPFFILALARMILSELLPVFTLLFVIFFCAMGIVLAEENLVSWCVFSFITVGFIAAGWQLCKIYAPEVLEKAAELFRFGVGEQLQETPPPTPAKKVDLKVWGENVKLESEEWDDDE